MQHWQNDGFLDSSDLIHSALNGARLASMEFLTSDERMKRMERIGRSLHEHKNNLANHRMPTQEELKLLFEDFTWLFTEHGDLLERYRIMLSGRMR